MHEAQNENPCSTEARMLWESHPDPAGRLFFVLNSLQERHRFISSEAIDELAREAGVERDEVESFVRFFDAYSLEAVGDCLIEVCDGTACHARGSNRLLQKFESLLGIREGETSADGRITLRRVHCVGSCSSAPVVVMGDETFGKVRVSRVCDIVGRAMRDDTN